MTSSSDLGTSRWTRTQRRAGYLATIVANGIVLLIANNLLAWGWFSWLTEDFDEVLPWINISILASILVNAIFVLYDEEWFKTTCELVTIGLSLLATAQMLRVFPFDFSAYSWNWEATVRILLILAIVGMSAGFIANTVKLIQSIVGSSTGARTPS